MACEQSARLLLDLGLLVTPIYLLHTGVAKRLNG